MAAPRAAAVRHQKTPHKSLDSIVAEDSDFCFDLTEMIENYGRHTDVVKVLMAMMPHATTETMRHLDDAIKRGDWESAFRHAHDMKTLAAWVRAESLFACAMDLNLAVKNCRYESVADLHASTKHEFKRLVEDANIFCQMLGIEQKPVKALNTEQLFADRIYGALGVEDKRPPSERPVVPRYKGAAAGEAAKPGVAAAAAVPSSVFPKKATK